MIMIIGKIALKTKQTKTGFFVFCFKIFSEALFIKYAKYNTVIIKI